MAFTWPLEFHTLKFCAINKGICYYVPWFVVRTSAGDLMLAEDFGLAGHLFSYIFTLFKDKELERIKPYKQRKIELIQRSKILREKSRDKIYNQIVPILKSYPKMKIPSSDPSSIGMPQYVYKVLKGRFLMEIAKEIKQGIFHYREPITISRDLTYPKERIIDEVKNYNIIAGMYDAIKKFEELEIAFTNFFLQHSLEEATDLLVELLKINLFVSLKCFQEAKKYILKRRPEKEKDLFELEKNGYEKAIYAPLFEEGEHIIAHFKGRVILPKAHLEFPGHVMVTDYRVLGPNIPGAKTITVPVTGLVSGLIVSAIASVVNQHIIDARKKFMRVLSQNEDMFFIQNPYDIKISPAGQLSFAMNYEYTDERTSEKKIYKLIIRLGTDKYNNESRKEYDQRKQRNNEKIQDILEKKSQIKY